jgi:hypothetical protein
MKELGLTPSDLTPKMPVKALPGQSDDSTEKENDDESMEQGNR